MSKSYERQMAKDARAQRERAEKWRVEAERLRSAIRRHQDAILVEENFGADDILWAAALSPGRTGATHCSKGHSLEDAIPASDGGRRCRTCHRGREAMRRLVEAVAA